MENDKEQAFLQLKEAVTTFQRQNSQDFDLRVGKSKHQKAIHLSLDLSYFEPDEQEEQEEMVGEKLKMFSDFWKELSKQIPLAKLQGMSDPEFHVHGIFRWKFTIKE